MKKIYGVSVWTWGFGLGVLAVAVWLAIPKARSLAEAHEKAKIPKLEIVDDALWEKPGHCEVRGRVHNPTETPARGVRIRYEIHAQKLKGETLVKEPRGWVETSIRYVPANESVDFTTSSTTRVDKYEVPGRSEAKITVEGK